MWIQLWANIESVWSFAVAHLFFCIGAISIFFALFFATRVSKDGQFYMRDEKVYKLARCGATGIMIFWFFTCILRLGVFLGW